MYANYDETEIGALDCEEIEGDIDPSNDVLLQIADEFEKTRKRVSINIVICQAFIFIFFFFFHFRKLLSVNQKISFT